MPRQVRNPCSGCGRLASTALIRPSVLGPILPAQRRNRFGVAPMGAGHVVGVRAVLTAEVAALVRRDALAAMECLDRARGDANLDLGADQRVWKRVEEVMDLDVVIEVD